MPLLATAGRSHLLPKPELIRPTGNGPAALRQLDAHPEMALLFTDIVTPDMNGHAVVHNGALDRR